MAPQPENKALLAVIIKGKMIVDNSLIRPYFLAELALGGVAIGSH